MDTLVIIKNFWEVGVKNTMISGFNEASSSEWQNIHRIITALVQIAASISGYIRSSSMFRAEEVTDLKNSIAAPSCRFIKM